MFAFRKKIKEFELKKIKELELSEWEGRENLIGA